MDDRATIADVAREAGVSRQTVSRVLNGKGEISPVTQARVQAVIERLGYRPSSIARGLATRKTLTIGLVVPDIANPFFAEVCRGAEEAARDACYSILLCNTAEDTAREAAVLTTLEDQRVDGILLCSSRLPTEQLAALAARQPPVVLLNRRLPDGRLRSACVDDKAGAVAAIRHLLARGRTTIGFLAGPSTSHSSRERGHGYVDGLAAAGRAADSALQINCPPDYEGGRAAAHALLSRRLDVDALLCYNDLTAAGALTACKELGRRVPEDVAVVGADDILLAALVTPPLTTLRIDMRALGAAAIDCLLAEIGRHGASCEDVLRQPELIVRASAP